LLLRLSLPDARALAETTLASGAPGAAAGAAIGALAGSAGTGAAIGGITGLAGGYLYDQYKQGQQGVDLRCPAFASQMPACEGAGRAESIDLLYPVRQHRDVGNGLEGLQASLRQADLLMPTQSSGAAAFYGLYRLTVHDPFGGFPASQSREGMACSLLTAVELVIERGALPFM
jgi:hypothetical protein